MSNKLKLQEFHALIAKKENDQFNHHDCLQFLNNRWAYCVLVTGLALGVVISSADLNLWRFLSGKNPIDTMEDKSTSSITVPTIQSMPATKGLSPMAFLEEDSTSQPQINSLDASITVPTIHSLPPAKDLSPMAFPEEDSTSQPQINSLVTINDLKTTSSSESSSESYHDYGASNYQIPSRVFKPDPPLLPQRESDLAQEWGKWDFIDKKQGQRPSNDYCADFPNRDIPHDQFPTDAWQTDIEYLKDWLDQGIKLADRAMEAILSEYGHGEKDEAKKSFEERSEMFQMTMYDLADEKGPKPGKDNGTNGGWTTNESFQGLVRRLLHALVTNDSFNVILGGHSAAAGHGNHFKQSYIMQFHKIMEPVFNALGVPLLSRNLARGGLGTLQDSLGFRDMYGEDIDVLIWDSGMTEGRDKKAVDTFYRQGLISGNRVPYILDGGGSKNIISFYHLNANADVGAIGSGMVGIPECVDEIQCEKFPYATRYMKCSAEAASLCNENENRFNSNCWVEREDVKPTKKQNAKPGSQVKWHPGFRFHQIEGRILAFTVLRAIKQGLEKWQQADQYKLPDDAWHVTNYYTEIRTKTIENNLDGGCKELPLPSRMCDIPIHGRTEFTPRPNPELTSIVSLVKVNENGYKPHVASPYLYTGPDVHNPFMELPAGAIDVQAIVNLGRKFEDDRRRAQEVTSSENMLSGFHREMSSIVPGLGWEMSSIMPGYCDGSYTSECGRHADNECLLSGHNDFRGGLLFGSYSGWLVMTLPAIRHGIIVVKIESWHQPSELSLVKGWTSIDNKGRRLLRGNVTEALGSRELKADPPEYCDNFNFEFAIDGKITTWNKARFAEESKNVQRVVEVVTLLDEPNFTDNPKDVELAIRMTGCGDSTRKTFSLTHVYFA